MSVGWHLSAVPTALSNVRYRGWTSRHMLIARFSHFDPERTSRGFYTDTCGAFDAPLRVDIIGRWKFCLPSSRQFSTPLHFRCPNSPMRLLDKCASLPERTREPVS